MGMTDLLARCAARRAHVLPVEVPGHWVLRASLESRLAARGWRPALSPADADVLAVCGPPGHRLAEVVDRVWDQLPGPRARIDIADLESVDSMLDQAAAALLDTERHCHDARTRRQSPDLGGDHAASSEHMHGHGDDDHGDMEMAPAGIALAQGADDRDGLEMDVLHLPLGPVLAYWPAGLVLRCTVHGDVIAEAEAEVLDGSETPTVPEQDGGYLAAARQCDHITSLLALAGWPQAATIARHARDLLLTEPRGISGHAALDRLQRTVRRSRILRWSLQDLEGDIYDGLLRRIGLARDLLSKTLPEKVIRAPHIGGLPDVVTGLDVATARLVIAGLGVETATTDERSRP